jgi:SpoVK/Ycf46/Vps4 family AAA+-type ATPase
MFASLTQSLVGFYFGTFSSVGVTSVCQTLLVQVDALLGERSHNEHEVSRNMRTEFMQLWDGLLKSRRVLVVAATNQPDRLPDAIWRRFSSHFEVRCLLDFVDSNCACVKLKQQD